MSKKPLRSKKELSMEERGVKPLQGEDEDIAQNLENLCRLMAVLDNYRKNYPWPGYRLPYDVTYVELTAHLHGQSIQEAQELTKYQIYKIGEELRDHGGGHRMKQVAYRVKALSSHTQNRAGRRALAN